MNLSNQQLLDLASKITKKVGKKLAKKANGKVTTKFSDKHDIKLLEDEESENLIVKYLWKKSEIPILGEENHQETNFLNGKVWIVDPIDGTVNFSRGIPISSVSIALWENGQPLLGIVYDFNRDVLYSGIIGVGAFRNGKKIAVSQNQKKSDSILFTGKPVLSHLDDSVIKQWFCYFEEYRKVRMIGSASLSLCYVASGNGDVYTEDHIQIWDFAAGVTLVQAAGGKITFEKSDKNKFSYIVKATNGHIQF
ncbi:inositol monophosphatase family protein [Leptospira levettii]|uniref:inositol monophosphatase family protein n=1 Tax=Leptospira levettii TaxID=2023178 RepID=UPI001083E582|nr:inositol monophosphatase family protein [Leptospira levettii]TGK97392.1 inositol monophosphatase [Leptospira levettii]TGL11749.1 inositol monophosphatase [Leptospira levettii]